MKVNFWLASIASLALVPSVMVAQKPADATGQCKDGSYTSAKTKSGACRGHKGIDTWYADASSSTKAPAASATSTPASAPAKTAAATPAPAPAPAPKAAPAPAKSTQAAAPGGGPGLVWVNTSSNVYHCYGTKYYGTTKQGKYETEAQAKAAGAHAERNVPCSK